MARMAESRTDSLTGLANRRRASTATSRRCTEAWRQQTNLSVIMLDVDDFKIFNDTHGHDAGDYVLQQVARRMMDTARAMDSGGALRRRGILHRSAFRRR